MVPKYIELLVSEGDYLPYCDIIITGELVVN